METIQDLKDKIEWEGSIIAAMEYGITAEDIPDDGTEKNRRLYNLWGEARSILSIIYAIETLLDEYDEE